jgi:hypothetical protein
VGNNGKIANVFHFVHISYTAWMLGSHTPWMAAAPADHTHSEMQ